MKPQCISLPSKVKITLPADWQYNIENSIDSLTYYSDCVFSPYIHSKFSLIEEFDPQQFVYNE